MNYIKIGKMINTHGIRGEIKIESWSDFDDERYRTGNIVYILFENDYTELKVKSYRRHKGFPLVTFENHENINDMEKYKGCDIFIDASSRKQLTDGRHYVDELIGMTAADEEGNEIGTVIDIEETRGAQSNMRVRMHTGKEVLIPYIPVFIKAVNDETRTITVHVIEGLL